MKIIDSNQLNINELLSLFMECFKEDKYYIKFLEEKEISFLTWTKTLLPQFKYIIKTGYSFGVLDENNKLIAFLLGFDYFKCKHDTPEMFNQIFEKDNNGKIPYENELHDKIETLKDTLTIFMPLIAVSPIYRNKKLASSLLDRLIETYPSYNIVSDISNENSLPMYSKRGFTIENIDKDYYFVYRKANKIVIKK